MNKIATWIQLNAESTFPWGSYRGGNSTEVLRLSLLFHKSNCLIGVFSSGTPDYALFWQSSLPACRKEVALPVIL